MRKVTFRHTMLGVMLSISLTLFVTPTANSAAASSTTSNAKKVAASIKTTTSAMLAGSKVTTRFRIGTYSDTTKLTVTDATRYVVDNERRRALNDGNISYESLQVELTEDEIAAVRDRYPSAQWYTVVAYDQALAETIGFTFDDLRYGVKNSKGWKTKKNAGLTEYQFTVPGTKAPSGEMLWYGVTKSSSVRFAVVLDTKQRITSLTITGPSKKSPESFSVKISYGPNVFAPPSATSVITWEQLIAVIPAMAPPVAAGWTRLNDLSPECAQAVGPLRALMDIYPSGLEIAGDAIDELNNALRSARGCPEAEYSRFYDLEFYGWFNGFERETASTESPSEDPSLPPWPYIDDQFKSELRAVKVNTTQIQISV